MLSIYAITTSCYIIASIHIQAMQYIYILFTGTNVKQFMVLFGMITY